MSRPAHYRVDLPPCPLTHKSSFRSPAKAKRAIREQSGPRPRLYAYQCPACGYWHVTSRPQDGRRAA